MAIESLTPSGFLEELAIAETPFLFQIFFWDSAFLCQRFILALIVSLCNIIFCPCQWAVILESNMAAAERVEAIPLREIFEQGFVLHCQIEDDDEPSTSEIFQVFLKLFWASKFVSTYLLN